MIYTEAKKLRLIEVLIKENNDEVLKKVEKILTAPASTPSVKFANFSNKLSRLELEELEKNIEDGCEQINEYDWK
ncbi:MAG: hypothetical protein M3N14_10995 [Bacteroidota bacterium]|nr:hypothetical protein [Bacteroidota bacterium]